jgi:hypothetical protein
MRIGWRVDLRPWSAAAITIQALSILALAGACSRGSATRDSPLREPANLQPRPSPFLAPALRSTMGQA